MSTYLFEEEDISCRSLENAVGLPAGSIKSLKVFPSGAVEIDSDGLTAAQQTALRTTLVKLGLVRGKRPLV